MRVTISPQVAIADSFGTWRISFVLQADSMAPGGGVKVRLVKGFVPAPQFDNPELAGYVEARTSNARANVKIVQIKNKDPQVHWTWDREGWVVTAQVQGQALHKGDTITVVFGANPPKGAILPPSTAFVDSILVAYDLDGSGAYYDIIPRPALTILPLPAYRLAGYLPSTIIAGKPARAKIVVLDKFGNLATAFAGTITLTATDPSAILPKTVALAPSDSGRKSFEVVFNKPGIHDLQLKVQGKNPVSLWQVRTNPAEVLSGAPHYQVFWGDLHSHSSFSWDGYGTGSFLKAREAAGLDFYALTDHASSPDQIHGGITPQEWEAIKQNVIRYDEPGKFVTFPAYEFSADKPSGHHNIYFNAPNALVAEIPLFRNEDHLQVQKVWQLQNLLPPGIDMITVPHHTGIVWDKNIGIGPWVHFGEAYSHPQLRPLIEIYSYHGLSENYAPQHPLSYRSLGRNRDCANGPHYAQDGWAAGEILGVIASSDDHSSRPGQPYRGLAAVYATELTRDAIFEALKNRRTYGTTGHRTLLQFDIDGHMMGSQVTVERGKYPEIRVAVHGTDDIDFVEVLRWDKGLGRRENGHPLFETIRRKLGQGRHLADQFIDSTYAGSSVYYVRAKQKRHTFYSDWRIFPEDWAWSSPIWVNATPSLEVGSTEPVPRRLQIRQNYPNPFERRTSLTYYLPSGGEVEAVLYNTLGQHVQQLARGFQAAGWHALQLSSQGLSPGVYFIRLESGEQVVTRKILLMK